MGGEHGDRQGEGEDKEVTERRSKRRANAKTEGNGPKRMYGRVQSER